MAISEISKKIRNVDLNFYWEFISQRNGKYSINEIKYLGGREKREK